ncbi:MAG TPA: hypothetical protein VN203_16750, partial [Candidatus Acidoferrum sp.]|nr:hypothetical protein [Candidatus Acidoferrum sp.]
DMTDPAIVWTSAPGTLYKVNVNTTPPTFTPVYTVPNGAIVMDIFPISPTRLALATYDNQAITVNTDGTNPRFYPTSGVAEGAVMDRIFAVPGSSNQFAMLVKVNPDTPQETRYDATYDDSTSTLLHTFGPFHWGTPLEQHNTWDHEYFANGQAVYVNPMVINAGVMLYPIEMHIVNVDGTNDRMLYTSSSLTDWQNARSVHHWFGNTLGWYLLSLNPVIGSTYDGRYRDQFLKVDAATGSLTALGRNPTETISLQSDICGFWSLSLGNLNRRGDRINFNSCRSGATDNYILFLRGDAVRDTLR